MPGKRWSADEEKFFWEIILPQASAGLDNISHTAKGDHKKNWEPLSQRMKLEMTSRLPALGSLRRTYNALGCYEHYYQNYHHENYSPYAKPFVAKYKADLATKFTAPDRPISSRSATANCASPPPSEGAPRVQKREGSKSTTAISPQSSLGRKKARGGKRIRIRITKGRISSAHHDAPLSLSSRSRLGASAMDVLADEALRSRANTPPRNNPSRLGSMAEDSSLRDCQATDGHGRREHESDSESRRTRDTTEGQSPVPHAAPTQPAPTFGDSQTQYQVLHAGPIGYSAAQYEASYGGQAHSRFDPASSQPAYYNNAMPYNQHNLSYGPAHTMQLGIRSPYADGYIVHGNQAVLSTGFNPYHGALVTQGPRHPGVSHHPDGPGHLGDPRQLFSAVSVDCGGPTHFYNPHQFSYPPEVFGRGPWRGSPQNEDTPFTTFSGPPPDHPTHYANENSNDDYIRYREQGHVSGYSHDDVYRGASGRTNGDGDSSVPASGAADKKEENADAGQRGSLSLG